MPPSGPTDGVHLSLTASSSRCTCFCNSPTRSACCSISASYCFDSAVKAFVNCYSNSVIKLLHSRDSRSAGPACAPNGTSTPAPGSAPPPSRAPSNTKACSSVPPQPQPSRGPPIRSQAGGPTAWTTGIGAASTSATPPRSPLISSVQPLSCSRETASPGPPP